MYVILGIIILVMLLAVVAVAQIVTAPRKPFDRNQRRMELREEMHKRMRDKLLHGVGPDQDMFKDMEAEFESLSMEVVPNFKSEWLETSTGRILMITPQSKEQKLNIDVNADVITIKGESKQTTDTTSVSSSFTNSFPVPGDCDGSKVKMSEKGGNLLVELPFRQMKTVTAPVKEERKPLPPSGQDVQI